MSDDDDSTQLTDADVCCSDVWLADDGFVSIATVDVLSLSRVTLFLCFGP